MNNQRAVDNQSVFSITSGRHLVAVKTKAGRYRRNKTCIIVGLVTLFFISLLIALVFYARKRIKTYYVERAVLCDTEECMRIAASLKESMDVSVDPCDDFYKYVCGRWTTEHPIPETQSAHSWFDERLIRVIRILRDLLEKNFTDMENVPRAVHQTKILYKSCMDVESVNESDLSPIFSLLDKLNLPHIPAAITHETVDIIKPLANIKRELKLEVFIGVSVDPNPRDNRKNIITIGAPERENPFAAEKKKKKRLRKSKKPSSKDKNEENDPDDDLLEKMYIHDVIKEIISNGTAEYRMCKVDSSDPDEEILNVAENIFQIEEILDGYERYLDNTTNSLEEIEDADYMYVDDLQKITDEFVKECDSALEPLIIWKPFIEALFQDIIKSGWHRKYKVLISDLEYLKNIALLLSKTEQEMLETYIWWNVIDALVPYANESLQKILSLYLEKVTGLVSAEPRSLQCAKKVNHFMSFAVAWLFVDPKFHQKEGTEIRMMLSFIQKAFGDLVIEADWMDSVTKIATERKVLKMRPMIGYPEWLFKDGVLDQYYENIDLAEDQFLQNMAELLQDQMRVDLLKIRRVNDFSDPKIQSVNQLYNILNVIWDAAIPAGILQFPFYDLGLAELNYGAIGSILGHELTHGFDNYGRQYDTEGNYRQWWTNETIANYIERTQCFIDHYSSYFIKELNMYVDGELTLAENIADNGGLREAFYAYKNWARRQTDRELYLPGFTNFTNEQIFFLAFAHTWCETYTAQALRSILRDTHSPSNVRLVAALRNSKEFSEVWKCPAGSSMNPAEKCRIW